MADNFRIARVEVHVEFDVIKTIHMVGILFEILLSSSKSSSDNSKH